MSRKRSERKIEQLLAENEACEPLEGLLERLRADIPPLDKLGAAHLRTALEQRRVRRLPVLWLTAASIAFMLVGGALSFRLWQHAPFLARERAMVEETSQVPQVRQEGSRAASDAPELGAPADLSAPSAAAVPEAGPAPEPQYLPAPQGRAGGVIGGVASPALQESHEVLDDKATSLSQRDLEQIPAARDPWATLASEPGVLTDRVNVGGNERGQQSVFAPAEAPDGKGSPASPMGRPAAPPPGPPPPLADERRAAAARAAEAPKAERYQAPAAASRGMNTSTVEPAKPAKPAEPGDYAEFDSLEEMQAPAQGFALRSRGVGTPRLEAALLPWRRSAPSRLVIGLAPAPSSKKIAAGETKEKEGELGARSDQERRLEKAEAPVPRRPALAVAVRFEPAAVVRARWLGEEAWRNPGRWEYLTTREAAGKSSRLEVELRPGVGAEQVVALARFPETVRPRPLRLAEMARGWEGASWELKVAVLRAELAAGLEGEGAGLTPEEVSSLLARAREAEAARPGDSRAKELTGLARRLEASPPPP